MNDPNKVTKRLNFLSEDLIKRKQQTQEEAEYLIQGLKVKVISNFNGQQIGKSRKPLTGKILDIWDISFQSDFGIVIHPKMPNGEIADAAGSLGEDFILVSDE